MPAEGGSEERHPLASGFWLRCVLSVAYHRGGGDQKIYIIIGHKNSENTNQMQVNTTKKEKQQKRKGNKYSSGKFT